MKMNNENFRQHLNGWILFGNLWPRAGKQHESRERTVHRWTYGSWTVKSQNRTTWLKAILSLTLCNFIKPNSLSIRCRYKSLWSRCKHSAQILMIFQPWLAWLALKVPRVCAVGNSNARFEWVAPLTASSNSGKAYLNISFLLWL